MVPEVIESVQPDVRFSALGVDAADEALAFLLFHRDEVFAIEMIVHHRWPTIGKRPLVHRHCLVADRTGALCLPCDTLLEPSFHVVPSSFGSPS